MSSCDNSNIKQNYIVANTNEFDTLTACTGIWTSNIYGCSPINVNDLINLKVVNNNNILDRVLVIDPVSGLVQYRTISNTISGNTEIIDYTYNDKNTFIITRYDGLQFSASINTVTGFTVDGDIIISGNTFVNGDIEPISDGVTNIGTPLKRFREINTLSGNSSVWTSTVKVITPEVDLGLDSNNENRILNADSSILQFDILNGGNY